MIKIYKDDIVVYFEGEIKISYLYNNYKKVKTIYGGTIREKTSNNHKIDIKIDFIDEINYDNLVYLFKNENFNLSMEDLENGKLLTNLFIDTEIFTLNPTNIYNTRIVYGYEGDITLLEEN